MELIDHHWCLLCLPDTDCTKQSPSAEAPLQTTITSFAAASIIFSLSKHFRLNNHHLPLSTTQTDNFRTEKERRKVAVHFILQLISIPHSCHSSSSNVLSLSQQQRASLLFFFVMSASFKIAYFFQASADALKGRKRRRKISGAQGKSYPKLSLSQRTVELS